MFKRLLLAFSVVLFLACYASSAFAAWTIVETVIKTTTKQSDFVVIKLACISDASSTDYKLLNQTDIRGYYYYGMRTKPGAGADAPTGTFDLDVEDELNYHIHDTDAHSTTVVVFTRGSSTINAYWPVFSDISVVIATLGDANTADVYLFFVK